MNEKSKKRLDEIDALIEEGTAGVYFFVGERTPDGEVLFTPSNGTRAYTRDELEALAERYPDLIVDIAYDPDAEPLPPRYQDEIVTPEDLYRENEYVDAVKARAEAEGVSYEEAEAAVTDPDLLAVRHEMNERHRREAELERLHEEAARERAPYNEEMARRLERLNERARKKEARGRRR